MPPGQVETRPGMLWLKPDVSSGRHSVRRKKHHGINMLKKQAHRKSLLNSSKVSKNKKTLRLDLLKDSNESPAKSLDLLMETHFPNCTKADHLTRTPFTPKHLRPNLDKVKYITQQRVQWSINTFKPNKSAGLDGITPLALQKLGPRMIKRITYFYKKSVIAGYVTTPLCESKVIFIPKGGRDDYTVPKAFRPISLTSYLLKVLERVILNELETNHLINNPLSRDQHAFRKGSSCESALSDMVDYIEKSIYRNEYAVGVFLDITGAFDNLCLRAADRGMMRLKVPTPIRKWYNNYLNNRMARADLKGCQSSARLTKGTPQGGVLSPLIWNMAFDEFLLLFKRGPIHAIEFADDGALMVCGKDPCTITSILQKGIDKTTRWGEENGLTFGIAKTSAVVFTHKYTAEKPFTSLKLNGEPLPFTRRVKW